ncbi:WD repeat-containing protein 46-like [Acipenser ruthenus]|uniref:WD repeat-containing protein 46-like n=1 Tax=Acipenser ruthenus TaxID=7906 RepID=UPI0027415947|nr:WD repeat-containing protein 46-like [Acipenser ruthenus]
MATDGGAVEQGVHVGKKKAPKRYWDSQAEAGSKGAGEGQVTERVNQRPEKTRRKKTERRGKKLISGKVDPFPGPAPVPKERRQKFERGQKNEVRSLSKGRLKDRLSKTEEKIDLALNQAARSDLLLAEEAGFLVGDEGEDTCTIAQDDIAEAVDITSGAKYFNLSLSQFGPYRIDYTRNGRHLLLGGRLGHVASLDWQSKQLQSEMNVMESVNDVRWLHSENMFAVAQRKWLYIYDNQGVELHCVKKFNDVLRMEFLPYHFLLATASSTGFLQYLDVSVGREVSAICTKNGRLDVMTQNQSNAVVHLGHPTGTVTLWSPNQKEPLVKMLCHRGGVRAIAVDKTGTYMVTSGLDRKMKVFDIRSFKPLASYLLPAGATSMTMSQRGLLATCCGDTVQVYKDVCSTPVSRPYMAHRAPGRVWGVQFCPYEDVLGIGHGDGFTSMLVPGAGEANFDALDSNPFRSVKQRQEWEVKALLDKIQPELITLQPSKLGELDTATYQQRHKERVERLGFDPREKEKFEPKLKMKGRSSTGSVQRRKKKIKNEDQRELIKQSLEMKDRADKERKKEEKMTSLGQRSALERFQK